MKYIKNNVITSNPNIPYVSNPTAETIIANGWESYTAPVAPKTEWHHPDRKHRLIISLEDEERIAIELVREEKFTKGLGALAFMAALKSAILVNGSPISFYYFNDIPKPVSDYAKRMGLMIENN